MRSGMTESYTNDCVNIKITRIDKETVEDLVSLLSRIRQSAYRFVLLDFDNAEVADHPSSIEQRIEWSRRGQVLRNFLMQCPQYTLALLRGNCFAEPFEAALACCKVFATPNAKYGLRSLPMWGSLRQMVSLSHLTGSNIDVDYGNFGLDKVTVVSDLNEIDNLIDNMRTVTKQMSVLDRSLNSMLSEKNQNIDRLESVLFANREFFRKFRNIEFTNPQEFGNVTPDTQIFTMDVDRVELDRFIYWPPAKAKNTLSYFQVSQMENLCSQNEFPIKGRCVELGCGGGRLSMYMSKKDEVTEVVACDVNVAAIYWMAPILSEIIKPDWQKMRYLIGDYNTLEDDEGFDVAAFCASLHNTHDIDMSLKRAFDILKPGGILIVHDEHIYPVLFGNVFSRKKFFNPGPYSVPALKRRLKRAGFVPYVYRNITPGRRFPKLKDFVLKVLPTKWLNGWLLYSQLSMIAVKPAKQR